MKPDIESRADIDALMVSFYARAMKDEVIGHFFTEVVKLDLGHHLPIIGDFWETAVFATSAYRRHGRHPLQVHAELHQKHALRRSDFQRWLELFETTVDESFAGTRAEFIKERAHAIAARMQQFIARE